MEISRLADFDKEFKHLCKKYHSLEGDFKDFEEVLEAYISEDFDKYEILWVLGERIAALWEEVEGNFFKVKKFRCFSIARQSLNSGIRIIYCYDTKNQKIEFIEIYHKNDKTNHNIARIQYYYPKTEENSN